MTESGPGEQIRERFGAVEPHRRKYVVMQATLVVVFLAMMLIRGIDEKHRGRLGPLTDWYGDTLGLARTWGMFARPGDEEPLFVFAERDGGKRVQLSPLPNPSFTESYRDVRLRKFRSHLGRPHVRAQLGEHFALLHCSSGEVRELVGGRPQRISLIRMPRHGSTGEEKLLEVTCP